MGNMVLVLIGAGWFWRKKRMAGGRTDIRTGTSGGLLTQTVYTIQ